MSNTKKLCVYVARRGNTLHFRASKGGEPLTHEDFIQLQILESQATNTLEGLTGNSPIILDSRKP